MNFSDLTLERLEKVSAERERRVLNFARAWAPSVIIIGY
jgi:hypothetical protein